MTDRLFARSHAPVIELAEMSVGTIKKKSPERALYYSPG
jgi:hypothetical protein